MPFLRGSGHGEARRLARGRAIVWLAWTLAQRRLQRTWTLLARLGVLIGILGVVCGCLSFVVALWVGIGLVGEFGAGMALVAVEILVVLYCLTRLMGVLLGQDQSEQVSLEGFLHLPLAPYQVFAQNFVLSQLTWATVLFGPALLGLAVGFTALDVRNAMLVPASLALVLCLAALTHQFQGWLPRLIRDKRWRASLGFLLVMFLVSLMLIANLERANAPPSREATQGDETAVATAPAPDDVSGALAAATDSAVGTRRKSGLVLPSSFLAGGSVASDLPAPWPAVLATAGLTLVAAWSLRRSYRSTLARYRDGRSGAASAGRVRGSGRTTGRQRLFARVFGSTPAAIAGVTLRQWLRSAQGKILLLMPLFLGVALAFLHTHLPGVLEADTFPLTFIGMAAVFAMPLALSSNLFAFDGRGLRLYLMAGVSPKALLLGKHLALLSEFAVLAGGLLVATTLLQSFPVTHVVASVFQAGILFGASCVVGVALSMEQPYAVAYDSMTKGGSAKGLLAALAQVALVTVLIAIAGGAMAVERIVLDAGLRLPMYLLLSILEAILAAVWFKAAVNHQARTFEREADVILDKVTTTA